MSIQISPAKPAEDANGLEALHDELMKPGPAEPIVAVVIITRTKRVFGDNDSEDSDYPVVRFSQVEPVFDEDRAAALALLERTATKRTGAEKLDMPDADGEPVGSPFEAEESEPAVEPIVDHAPAPDPDAEAAFEEAAPEKPARRARAKRGNL